MYIACIICIQSASHNSNFQGKSQDMPLKQAKNRWLNLKMSNSVINVFVTVFVFILLLLGAVKRLS